MGFKPKTASEINMVGMGFNVTPEMSLRIKKEATEAGLSTSEYIRQALEYVLNEEDVQPQEIAQEETKAKDKAKS